MPSAPWEAELRAGAEGLRGSKPPLVEGKGQFSPQHNANPFPVLGAAWTLCPKVLWV